MSKKRDRIQVTHDILSAIREKENKIKTTQLLYKSNLNHERFEVYLNELIDKGLIIVHEVKGSKTYSVSNDGCVFLERYKWLREFMDTFSME